MECSCTLRDPLHRKTPRDDPSAQRHKYTLRLHKLQISGTKIEQLSCCHAKGGPMNDDGSRDVFRSKSQVRTVRCSTDVEPQGTAAIIVFR